MEFKNVNRKPPCTCRRKQVALRTVSMTVPLTYAAAVAKLRPPSAAVQYAPTPTFSSRLPANENYTPTRNYGPPPQPFCPARQYLAESASPVFNPWRTQDNRPICFSCGCAGHVARFCRRRAWYSDSARPHFTNGPDYTYRSAPAGPHFDAAPSSSRGYSTRRSPSPRRRSLSPLIRRPEAVNEEN